MKVTWDVLNSKTSSFRTLLETPANEAGEIEDVVFSGLHAKLSEILKNRTQGQLNTLTIYADTLVMDRPSFDAVSAVVVARRIDVSALPEGIISSPVPASGRASKSEFLIQESAGGTVKLAHSKVNDSAPKIPLPVGDPKLQVVILKTKGDGTLLLQTFRDKEYFEDVLNKIWALNSLKASFTAATWLMDSNSPEDRNVASQMLRWVTACVESWHGYGGAISTEYAELYSSAAAMLVTLSVAEGAYYVPVLASGYYRDQVTLALVALEKYETHLRDLDIQAGIEATIKRVGSALKGAANDSIVPLQKELEQIDGNIESLLNDIQILTRQFYRQQTDANTKLELLTSEIYNDAILKRAIAILKASFAIIAAVGTVGGSLATLSTNPNHTFGLWSKPTEDYFVVKDDDGKVSSGLPALIDALEALGDAGSNAYDIYGAATTEPGIPNKKLLDSAMALMKMQERALASFISGALLVGGPTDDMVKHLPEVKDASQADPSLAWDNFLIEADVCLKPIESTDSSKVTAALAAFHGSLKVLAGYGKANNAKLVSAAAQMSQGTLVRTRLRAAENTKQRWENLEAISTSSEEKQAALRGLIQVNIDSLKQSMITAWKQYRNSFFYLNFQEPPGIINMDLDTAGFSKAFVNVNAWIGRLREDTGDGKKVQLPNNGVDVSLVHQIVKADEPRKPKTALFTPATDGKRATISWILQLGDTPFQHHLPNQGRVAIWITEARFIPVGVTPNSAGNVIAMVSTSGSYENGFGPKRTYRFETKGIAGRFAYEVSDERVYNRWKIDSEVYTTPTPFTEWTMDFEEGDPATATELRMDLTIAYMEMAP